MPASTSWRRKARRSRSTLRAAWCASAERTSTPKRLRRSSRRSSAREESCPPSSTTARRCSRSLPRSLELDTGRQQEPGDHVVPGDRADQLDDLLVRQERAHLVDGRLFGLHIARHLDGELQRGALLVVEELRIRVELPQGIELRLGAAGLEELRLVLGP